MSKCAFGQSKVVYLDHIVSVDHVCPDSQKISAMLFWPQPDTIKQLCNFIGLTGYYHTFILGFATIVIPLTNILRKDSFTWTPVAVEVFSALKSTVTTALFLRLPNFSEDFVVETDVCQMGIGVVLKQQGQPIAFFSKINHVPDFKPSPPIPKNSIPLMNPSSSGVSISWDDFLWFALTTKVFGNSLSKLFKLRNSSIMCENCCDFILGWSITLGLLILLSMFYHVFHLPSMPANCNCFSS